MAECLTIERQACSNGYKRLDVCKKCPDETNVDCKMLETGIDVEELCASLNKDEKRACPSDNAGRYLCEYIFYKSLSIDPTKTLFVHVPDLDKWSSTKTAYGLYNILCHLTRNWDLMNNLDLLNQLIIGNNSKKIRELYAQKKSIYIYKS